MGAWIGHGAEGTGEPLVVMLRPGNAGSNTAADHKQVLADALAQLPFQPGYRVGKTVLVRTDSGGGTHEFVRYCHNRRPQYSVGFGLSEITAVAVDRIPRHVWTPAYNADGEVRDGAWVAELTVLLDLTGRPPGMRVIVRAQNVKSFNFNRQSTLTRSQQKIIDDQIIFRSSSVTSRPSFQCLIAPSITT